MNNMPLSRRVTVDVLICLVIALTAMGLFSFLMERSKVVEESAAHALSIAQSVSAALDVDQFEQIMSTGRTNAYYDSYTAILDAVYDRTHAEYVYVLGVDYGAHVTYFAEGYPRTPRPDEPRLLLGDTEETSVYPDEMFDTLRTGADSMTGAYDLGGFGEMVSGFSPIKDSSGRVVGVVGADIMIHRAVVASRNFGLNMLYLGLGLCALAAVIIVMLTKRVFTHLDHISGAIEQIGEKGALVFPPEVMESARKCSSWKNEIGLCARAFDSMVKRLAYLEEALLKITEGDLRVDVNVLSDGDKMGKAIDDMVTKLNDVLSNVSSGITQVSDGSRNIANGAQSLAQGATLQSSSIMELSDSLAEITKRTKNNAEMAEKASTLANTIMTDAEKGNRQMDEMIAAVGDINESSKNIGKIIKTIDDIAFQTNILALNAAVEAARAGQHGKGFAVVADEVRNLATKSAKAARDTGDMIQSSMDKAEMGVKIAEGTASSLTEIVSGINESSRLIVNIAHSSEEQTLDIEQINSGINQVSQVVQQNTATAEESAASSEEMNSQTKLLNELVAQFNLKDGAPRRAALAPHSTSLDR